MLDFRSGGWVLLLAGLLALAVVAWRLAAIIPTIGHARSGPDGAHVETFGFDLSNLRVPRSLFVAGGFNPDSLRAIDDPQTIAAGEIKAGEKLGGARKLVSADRVIAVEFGGEARAYPLWLMNWHEIVNDTVGGRAIAVTYSPLCDSAVVFDRRIGDEVLRFGVSGILYNSNLVLFDRREQRSRESLWSQLEARAIAGPAAGSDTSLRVLPCRVMPWPAWRDANPSGRVILPQPNMARAYKRDAYSTYFNHERVDFPVDPMPPLDGPSRKSPTLALRCADGPWTVLHVSELIARGGAATTVDVGGQAIPIQFSSRPPAAWVAPGAALPDDLQCIQSFWFAWYAAQGSP